MQRDTLFRITSMTKPMTATAVPSFVDDGLLKMDDPVDRWLPELADRQVLRRPDGPLDDTVPAQPATVPDPDSWIARLGELPLLAQPGALSFASDGGRRPFRQGSRLAYGKARGALRAR